MATVTQLVDGRCLFALEYKKEKWFVEAPNRQVSYKPL